MTPVLTSPLVSTQWLADHLGAEQLVVVDASVRASDSRLDPRWKTDRPEESDPAHVPGAVAADMLGAFSAEDADLPLMRPAADRFERAASDLGVSNASTVVVYDDELGQWSSRLWWLFRSFGFDDVAVLDGGFAKWSAEGRPVRAGESDRRCPAGAEGTFLAPDDRELFVDRDRIERAVDGTEPAALVFAADETDLGLEHPPIVPGTTTVSLRSLLDPATHAFRKPRALTSLLEPVLDADEIVTYCGVGNAACVDALALTIAGHEHVKVYDGSLADWWQHEPA